MTGIREITAEEVKNKLEEGQELLLIDIREDVEVAEGMIPSATHLRMGDIPESLDMFDKEKEYILVCRSGNRSHHACNYLQAQGYKMTNMVGGMLDWDGKIKKPE